MLAHIGDGTWGEGSVYEALNMASLWKLPVVVAVEHNEIAQTTPTALQLAGTIEARARAFDLAYVRIQGHDVAQIRVALQEPMRAARAGAPLVVEFETTRLGPHSKGDDTRPEAQVAAARARDWLPAYTAAFPDQLARLDVAVAARIDATFADVESRPQSTWERT